MIARACRFCAILERCRDLLLSRCGCCNGTVVELVLCCAVVAAFAFNAVHHICYSALSGSSTLPMKKVDRYWYHRPNSLLSYFVQCRDSVSARRKRAHIDVCPGTFTSSVTLIQLALCGSLSCFQTFVPHFQPSTVITNCLSWSKCTMTTV